MGANMIILPDYNELDIQSFCTILDRQGLRTSYKLFFFKAILECCKKGITSISFEALYDIMFKEAFPLVHTYKLKFSSQDLIERRIRDYSDVLLLKPNQVGKLSEHVSSLEKINIITSYVIFRLIRPFYSTQLNSPNDNVVNSRLLHLVNNDVNGLYIINIEHSTITINPKWTSYITLHQRLIEEWYKYNLIVFLQARNPSVPNIAFKVDASLVSRDLNAQNKLWQFASSIDPSIQFDIYLNKPFDVSTISQFGKFSLDHVIPFDFVMHNELWNLTPMHKNLNSMKNNRLPQNEHIERLISLQYSFYKTVQVFYHLKRGQTHPLSDYEELNPILNHNNLEIHEDDFSNILRNQITSLHSIALNQGFAMWQNNV